MSKLVSHFYEFGEFRLDAEKRRLLHHGKPVPLPPKSIEALLVLVQRAGELLEREALMQAVWHGAFVEDANLTVAVSNLRKALGQSKETAEYIETIPRVGYRFVADVREVHEERAPLVIEKHTSLRTVIEEELIHDEHQTRATTLDSPRQVAPAGGWITFINLHRTGVMLTVAALMATALGMSLYLKSERRASSAPVALTLSIKSIAVLPPRPLSRQAENASLSLGVADALSTRLGALHRIVVRPTSAIARYVDSQQTTVDVGRTLGVDAVLEGSLQRDNGEMRVTLRLIEVASGKQLWSGNFEETDANIFKLQDSISEQAAEALFLDLSQTDRGLLTRRETSNPEAYALYLKGSYYWNKRGDEATKSVEYFRKAIGVDPNFAQAYAALASVEASSRGFSPEADALIDKALQLDNTLADAHATRGFIRMFNHWDWAGAGQAFDRALELDPNSPVAHHWKGVYLSLLGRLDEAKVEMQRALELDPLSTIIMADIGQLHYFAHEPDQAIAYCHKALAFDGDCAMAHEYLIDIYRSQGLEAEAFNEDNWVRFGGKRPPRRYQEIFAKSGFQGIISDELNAFLALDDRARALAAYQIARKYASLGNQAQALSWLNLACDDNCFLLPFINIDPVFDTLRSDPSFQRVLQRMSLPQRSTV